jgi:hypothetical protein
VQWGTVLPWKIGEPVRVQLLGDEYITRSGSNDGHNSFTTPDNLLPNVQYGFRVRDFDVLGLAATSWGDWLVLTTTPTDQVQLVLDDAASTTLGPPYTLQPDGSFSSTTVPMPGSVHPGTYTLWATMDGQKIASTILTVVAQRQVVSPQLQVFDPDTRITIAGTAGVNAQDPVHLRGYNFQPGPVELFVDSRSGPSLGSATVEPKAADPNGCGPRKARPGWKPPCSHPRWRRTPPCCSLTPPPRPGTPPATISRSCSSARPAWPRPA